MSTHDFAPWQRRVYERAVSAFDAGRMGHALLFAGPERLGKRRVAERLAQRLLCTGSDAPCGHCRSCQLFLARTQRDPPEQRPDGTPAHPFGHTSHPDALFVGFAWKFTPSPPKQLTQITVDQIRELGERLAKTPQYGVAQVAIVEPADALNEAAANALLKTLEEPVPGRYLWLVSAQPERLPATIRSRCQRLEFRLPPAGEAAAWLQARGHAAAAAAEALEAARGHPGLADAWLRDGSLQLRREVAADLAKLARGDASAVEAAQRWVADERAPLRLRFAADLALQDAAGLTDAPRTRRLAAWFDAANRSRALLQAPVRADLAVAELLLAWQREVNAAARATGMGR